MTPGWSFESRTTKKGTLTYWKRGADVAAAILFNRPITENDFWRVFNMASDSTPPKGGKKISHVEAQRWAQMVGVVL